MLSTKRTIWQRFVRVTLYRPVAMPIAHGACAVVANAHAIRRAAPKAPEPLTLDRAMRAGGVESRETWRKAYRGKRVTALALLGAVAWSLWMLAGAPNAQSAIVDAASTLIFAAFYSLLAYQLWLARQLTANGTVTDPTLAAYCEAVVSRPLEALPLPLGSPHR